jgi:hypothetical protein
VTGLGRRVSAVILGHAVAYVPLAALLHHNPRILEGDGDFYILAPTSGTVALGWLAGRICAAVADTHAALAARRPVASDDYLPGAVRTDVNHAA